LIDNPVIDQNGRDNIMKISTKANTENMTSERSFDDNLAWLNLQGEMGVWRNNRIKLDYVLKKTRRFLKPSLSACDIGLGEGYTLEQFYKLGMKTTGIDISKYMIDYLEKKYEKSDLDIELITGDISQIEVRENRFDIVTCFDILEHIPDENLKLAMINIKRSLVNGGLLIGTLPYKENKDVNSVVCPECGHGFHRYGHFQYFQNMEEIENMLQPGFTMIDSGEVPYTWFKSSMLNYAGTKVMNFIKRMSGTKYSTIAYFVARLNKY
jgi:2-polyprenyl-3-methyl-5-hydroxy-6-metoxy-1,4-benzoquinol methylase